MTHSTWMTCAGMTNRKDMIDEALIRPGRLEVQMEIGLSHAFLNDFLMCTIDVNK